MNRFVSRLNTVGSPSQRRLFALVAMFVFSLDVLFVRFLGSDVFSGFLGVELFGGVDVRVVLAVVLLWAGLLIWNNQRGL